MTMQLNDAELLRETCYINGEWVAADSDATRDVLNPANGEVLAHVPDMGAAETRKAIELAEAAWLTWREKTAAERAGILRRWYELMLEHKQDLATIMTLEQG
ncbi:MAG: aldehyde dehydrogenase family protein, partial [Gammaproteobacteria bacterium]|nr:aldehyde dehydrogenase family protein [Gammaproteobacteria bacterium]